VAASGVEFWPGLVRTSALGGPPPIPRSVCTRDHVSVMRGITMDGRLSTLVREAVRDSRDSVLCLTPLLPHVSEHLLVSWDGSPIPKGHVRTFVAEGGARPIHLAPLPPYASDLHPGEGVWHQWKNGARRNLCCLNRAHLRRELSLALKRLRRKPHVLTACVAQAGLSGETYVLHATVCKNLRLPHLHGCFRQRLRAHQLSYRLIHLPAHTALV
jgi:hypothetical protein